MNDIEISIGVVIKGRRRKEEVSLRVLQRYERHCSRFSTHRKIGETRIDGSGLTSNLGSSFLLKLS